MKRSLLVLLAIAALFFIQNPTSIDEIPEALAVAAPTASGALAPVPLNFNFDAPSQVVDGEPENNDFEDDNLNGWTVDFASPPITTEMGGPPGSDFYAEKAAGFGRTMTSDTAVTISNDAQYVFFDARIGPDGFVRLSIATNAPLYDDFNSVGTVSGNEGVWQTSKHNIHDFRGMTAKFQI